MVLATIATALLLQSQPVQQALAAHVPPQPAPNPTEVASPASQSAPISVVLRTQASFPGGDQKEISSFSVPDIRAPKTVYVYTPATVCEPSLVSDSPPDSAAYGWSVDILPRQDGGAEVRWRRMFYAGAATRSASGSRVLPAVRPNRAIFSAIDSVDGGSRLEIRRKLQTLLAAGPLDREFDTMAEVSADPGIVNARAQVEALERRLKARAETVGPRHPDIVSLVNDINHVKEQIAQRKQVLHQVLVKQYQDAVVPLRAVNGCNALSMTLEAGITKRATSSVMEAELWFIHRAPDGKETTQRQAVRMRDGGRGDFYFDDLTITANIAGRSEPITLEVFGSLSTGAMMDDGEIHTSLQLTRRYINAKAAELGGAPTVGKGEYPMTLTAGEVVSFILPPLESDRGQLLGHRFSVRLRIRPAGEGN